jgi:hypothetical protein
MMKRIQASKWKLNFHVFTLNEVGDWNKVKERLFLQK